MGDQQASGLMAFASVTLWPTCHFNDSGHFHPLIHLWESGSVRPLWTDKNEVEREGVSASCLEPSVCLGADRRMRWEGWGVRGVWITTLSPTPVSCSCQAGLGCWRAHSQRGSAWLCQDTNKPEIQPRASGDLESIRRQCPN